jgi:hypothetical protein
MDSPLRFTLSSTTLRVPFRTGERRLGCFGNHQKQIRMVPPITRRACDVDLGPQLER